MHCARCAIVIAHLSACSLSAVPSSGTAMRRYVACSCSAASTRPRVLPMEESLQLFRSDASVCARGVGHRLRRRSVNPVSSWQFAFSKSASSSGSAMGKASEKRSARVHAARAESASSSLWASRSRWMTFRWRTVSCRFTVRRWGMRLSWESNGLPLRQAVSRRRAMRESRSRCRCQWSDADHWPSEMSPVSRPPLRARSRLG